jgi:hypothetical protein
MIERKDIFVGILVNEGMINYCALDLDGDNPIGYFIDVKPMGLTLAEELGKRYYERVTFDIPMQPVKGQIETTIYHPLSPMEKRGLEKAMEEYFASKANQE